MYRRISPHRLATRLFQLEMTTVHRVYHPALVRQLYWSDYPGDLNVEEYNIYTQFVNTHFIDIEQDEEELGATVANVKLPYERAIPTEGSWLESAKSHVVRRASRVGDFLLVCCVDSTLPLQQRTSSRFPSFMFPRFLPCVSSGLALVRVDIGSM